MPTIDRSRTSPNHRSRAGVEIALIVLHATVGSARSALDWLTSPASGVSTHYLITKRGHIYQLVDEDRDAAHAGRSAYPGVPSVGNSINAASLGIELENKNDGADPYPPAQLAALTWLVRDIEARRGKKIVTTHEVVALPKGRKSDPAGFPLDAFLAKLRPAPVAAHGLVLTNAPMARLKQSMASAHYTALKVVTAWGLGRPWTEWERREVLGLVPSVLVRTHAGDPSSGRPFPHWEEVVRELQPWVLAGATLVEIGNEPDASAVIAPAGYAWHLSRAREAVQRAWPHVKVCSPGLLGELRGASWIADPDFAAAVRACDYVGCHLYEHTTFSGPGHTNKFDEMERLYARFGQQPRMITEYGINRHPDGAKYARFVQGLRPPYAGAFAYHLDVSEGAEYQLGLAGDAAYGQVMG